MCDKIGRGVEKSRETKGLDGRLETCSKRREILQTDGRRRFG
jgi:hypothetical protein